MDAREVAKLIRYDGVVAPVDLRAAVARIQTLEGMEQPLHWLDAKELHCLHDQVRLYKLYLDMGERYKECQFDTSIGVMQARIRIAEFAEKAAYDLSIVNLKLAAVAFVRKERAANERISYTTREERSHAIDSMY